MAKKKQSAGRTRVTSRSTGGRRRTASDANIIPWNIPLGKMNLYLLVGGVAVIVVGYLLMSTGIPDDPANNEGIWNNTSAVVLAPLLLTIGYCVIVPVAIFYRGRKNAASDSSDSE